MSFLEGLHRKRYLVLRGLRLAQQRAGCPAPGAGPDLRGFRELVEFLDRFALEHFLDRELALLEQWERGHPARRRVAELSTLRQARQLGADLVHCLARALEQEQADAAQLRGDLCRLISHLSRTLARGDQAVAALEQGLADADDALRRALAEALPEDEETERRYVAVIQVLEGDGDEGS